MLRDIPVKTTRAAALTLAGVTKGGLPRKLMVARCCSDNNGNPTGVLEERAMELIQDILLPERIDKIELALGLATVPSHVRGETHQLSVMLGSQVVG